jgi:hypothetical protein
MSTRIILWTVIGIAAGVTHAASLWRSSHARIQGWSAVLRLPVVAAALVSAALVHTLLPAAVGWFAGLTLASIVYLLRTRQWM